MQNDKRQLISPVIRIGSESTNADAGGFREQNFAAQNYFVQTQQAPMPQWLPAMSAELQNLYFTAAIEVQKEKAKTSEIRSRVQLNRAAKHAERVDRKEERLDEIAEKELADLHVFMSEGRVKMAARTFDGQNRRVKTLIDEPIISAKKFVAASPNEVAVMVLIFRKGDKEIRCLYDAKVGDISNPDLIALLKSHGIHVNVSRRTRADAAEGLRNLFENLANKVEIPFVVGYTLTSAGKWQFARPGCLTMNDMKVCNIVGGNENER